MSSTSGYTTEKLEITAGKQDESTPVDLINFRDVSDNIHSIRIKKNMIFRSSAPHSITDRDLEYFATHVRFMIDTRDVKEAGEKPLDPRLRKYFTVVEYDAEKRRQEISEKTRLRSNTETTNSRRYCNMKMNGTNLALSLLGGCSVGTIFSIPYIFLRYNRAKFIQTALYESSHKEVSGFYIRTLQACRKQMLAFLNEYIEESNYPIMTFCSVGKDRTGVLIVLILGCLGATRQEIIQDYSLSRVVSENAATRKAMGDCGFPESFWDLKPEQMEKMIDWIERNYGTISKYLTSIGFDEAKQKKLKEIVLVSDEPTSATLNKLMHASVPISQ